MSALFDDSVRPADESNSTFPANSDRDSCKKERILMRSLGKSVKRFLVSEDGPTAVEYAVMLALIVVVCLSAVGTVGSNANTKFEAVRDALT